MDDPKIIQLVKSLLGATREGRLRWSPNRTADRFTLSLEHANIAVEREFCDTDEGTRADHWLFLQDDQGKVIKSAFFLGEDAPEPLIVELYDAARDSATGVPEIIDKLIHEIEVSRSAV